MLGPFNVLGIVKAAFLILVLLFLLRICITTIVDFWVDFWLDLTKKEDE